MNKLVRNLLWCALLLHADFQPSSWKYRRPLPAGTEAPIEVVNIDRGIYVGAQPGLDDLRIVNGQGEVPYVLERISGSRQRTEVASNEPINQGVTASGRPGINRGCRTRPAP